MAGTEEVLINDAGTLKKTTTQDIADLSTVEFESTFSSDHTYTGITTTATAGEALAFGDFVYYKFSDSKWWKADADTYATARCKAMAVATISADATGVLLLKGTVRDDTWNWTAADVWLSKTAGSGTNTVPQNLRPSADRQ